LDSIIEHIAGVGTGGLGDSDGRWHGQERAAAAQQSCWQNR